MKLLLTILLACSVRLNAAFLVGPIINPDNGHQYYLLEEDTWTNSESQAIALGGHLATVTDADENSWIFSTFGNYGGVSRRLWIGLTDQNTEGKFQWITGEPLVFAPWATDQPDNAEGIEDYVHINGPIDLQPATWNDLPDIALGTHGVVEVVPEPSTSILITMGFLFFIFLRSRKFRLLSKYD